VTPQAGLLRRRGAGRQAHEEQADDDGQIAYPVPKEAPTLAKCRHEHAGQGGSHHPGAVEHGRIECNGVVQVRLAHHLHHERLPGRHVHGRDDAKQHGQPGHQPHRDMPGKRKAGQRQRLYQGRRLRDYQKGPFVPPVGQATAPESEQKHRNLADEADQAEIKTRSGQTVDQPGNGHGLHPGTDERDELSREKKSEIPMMKRTGQGGPAGMGRTGPSLGGNSACHGTILPDGRAACGHTPEDALPINPSLPPGTVLKSRCRCCKPRWMRSMSPRSSRVSLETNEVLTASKAVSRVVRPASVRPRHTRRRSTLSGCRSMSPR